MNITLRKEIVRHIFDRFALLPKNLSHNKVFSFLSAVISDEFVIDKRIVFVEEDKKYQNKTT